jgi:hypothetical protein
MNWALNGVAATEPRRRQWLPILGTGDSMARYHPLMRNEFTAIVERDGELFIAYCPEVPGANGQEPSKAVVVG